MGAAITPGEPQRVAELRSFAGDHYLGSDTEMTTVGNEGSPNSDSILAALWPLFGRSLRRWGARDYLVAGHVRFSVTTRTVTAPPPVRGDGAPHLQIALNSPRFERRMTDTADSITAIADPP